MSGTRGQKKDNFQPDLQLSRGGRYAERPMRVFTAAEIRLDGDMQALLGDVRGADGHFPSRGFQRVAYGEAFPWRVLARWLVAARRRRAPKAKLAAALLRLVRFLDDIYDDHQLDRAA